MTQENRENLNSAAMIIGAGIVGGTLYYLKIKHEERKVQRKIDEWKLEGFQCIANGERRLIEIAMDPTKTVDDFVKAVNEERAFMSLFRSNPPKL